MGNCFAARSKVDNSLSSHHTNADSTKVPGRSIHSLAHTSSNNDEGKPEALPTPRSEDEKLSTPQLKAFTFNDLKNATRNFRPDSLLGQGGFGHVYKGWIDERSLGATRPGCGMIVAVKKLKPEGFQGHKEWRSEVNYLGQLHHPNLVKLFGHCLDRDNRLLVYEYMPKGSLENHLFCRGARPLPWATRNKVAVDAAQGLTFLHESEQPVIYRDFKASNILLDSDFNAKLSDFGLAKAGPTLDRTHVSTQVLGTQGYAAPEYIATGRLTARCDIYSFGVVLLELLSGRHAVDKTKPGVEQNLVDWARPYLGDRRKLFRIMDAKLEGQYPQRAAHTAAILALQCISEAKIRPPMSEVLATLEQLPTMRHSISASPCRSERKFITSPMRDKMCVSSPKAKSPMRHSHHYSVDRKSVSSYISDISIRSPLASPAKSPMMQSPRGIM